MSEAGYFESLDTLLQREGVGRPVVLLDMDRVDHNLALIEKSLGHRLRIVTKSLPSLDLIGYVMAHAGTHRLMAFHLPFFHALLAELPGADILAGKPFLVAAVREFFAAPDADPHAACDRVQWLIDTPQRLDEYLAFAREQQLRLRINIEIDIGLHRGGVSEAGELHALLDVIAAHPEQLRFSGMMGYDAHVPFMPEPDAAFSRAMERYAALVRHGEARHPALFAGELTFNSGGSKTLHRFHGDWIANDIAAGSAVVKPATFSVLDTHLPALFIAAPVIRKFARVSRHSIEPAKAMSLYLYGGGWAAELVHPEGVTISPHADPPNENLLPNQCLFETSLDTRLDIGNFVFFHPRQSDAMVQFEEILLVRDGVIVDRWHPFPRRF